MKRLISAATLLFATAASAQQAHDPSAQLSKVLPTSIADHVLATIADARAHSLPAAALEQRALELSRKGAKPADIQKSVDRSAADMKSAKGALEKAGHKPTNDEVVAGSALLGRGVDGAQISAFAKSAPRGRPLGVAMYVIGSLMDRDLKSDDAIAKVSLRLAQNATDKQLVAEANAVATAHRPATANKAGGLAHRPVSPPVGARPVTPGRPATAGRRG
ncbi:MAG: hypothetical protein ACJ791_09515 [Gemmatimonadaceae bacterium]